MRLEVPYKSQLSFEKGGPGERRWCGIACLWMVLAYLLKENAPTVEELLEKYGREIEERGFLHQDFLKIARDYGLSGFRKSWWAQPGVQLLLGKFRLEGETEQEIDAWMETNIEESFGTIEKMVLGGIPVTASVTAEFSPSQSTHLIVIVGVEDNHLIIHDPLKKGANFKISRQEFKKYWLRQAMIILPASA